MLADREYRSAQVCLGKAGYNIPLGSLRALQNK